MSSEERETEKPLVVGIIGGIGSGKSEVARLFAELAGAKIISGDAAGHEALMQPEIQQRIVQRWGEDLLKDGRIDRRRLGAIVFQDDVQRRALEAIVHPWIKARLRELLEDARAQRDLPLIILDAAIMLEAGWSDACDQLVFVDVPREQRLQRIAQQRGWTESEVAAREQAQWSLDEKRKHCRHVLRNSGSREDLSAQVTELLQCSSIALKRNTKQASIPRSTPSGANSTH